MTRNRGAYVTIDGPDGAGKSTQVASLAEATGSVVVREPGGTGLGTKIRTLLLNPEEPIDPMAELFLFTADRAQLARQIIRPGILSGRSVVSDRSLLSTLAYQLRGSGLDLDSGYLLKITELAMGGLVPDVRIVLDVPPEVSVARLALTGKNPDRFESEGLDFFKRVRDGFIEFAQQLGGIVIDASGTPEEVFSEMYSHCGQLLEDGVPLD